MKKRLRIAVLVLLGLLHFAEPTFLSGAVAAETQALAISVSGVISDSSGEPLVGATIVEKGTTNGTTSDFDGSYSLTVQEGAILEVSYTGYSKTEIEVGDQRVINIQLEEASELLDEVVVVGYGIQKKRDVTGAISTIDNERLEKIPVASGVQAMQGQVAGVDITNAGGRPGQAPTIRIRGRRSISASNDPLFVIDGIPQTSGTNAIQDINPQDIQSMEVLKDAAATAIYGSRGANGVVIITTKRGSEGRTIVSYDGYVGTTSAISNLDMMNAEQWSAMRREAFRNGWDGAVPPDEDVFFPEHLEARAAGRDVDWLDLVLKDGWQTNHQLGFRGGSEKTQFNVSLGYFNEDGIIDGMDYGRITGRMNLDHKISEVFSSGISFTLSNSTQNWGSSAVMGEALGNVPLAQPFEEDGSPQFLPTTDGIRTNPLSELVPDAYLDERKVTRIFSPVYIRAKILDGLTFTSTFGPDIRFYQRGEFRASETNDNRGGPADAEFENITDYGYTLENLVNYNRPIGNSNLGVTLLQSIQSFRQEQHKSEVANLPYESQLFYNIGTGAVKGNLSSDLEEWSLASFMGRVNYEIAGKYMIQATLRADGSSRLSGDKWNYFPGLSVGWQVGEDLFSDVAWLNNLKLRASYGEVGNTSVDPYQTAGRLTRRVYSFGGANAFGFGLNEIPNTALNWEVSKTVDIGVDFDIINGRISGSLDWYRTNTEDILLERQLPPTSGYSDILQNIGSTRTSGLEFGINATLVETKDFTWSIDWNIAGYKEQITELALKDSDGNPTDDVGNRWFIGQPINVWYDYVNIGTYKISEADLAASAENKVPGEIKLQDLDGDGLITQDDRRIVGTDVPDYYGGFTTNFAYKGFDLSAFLYYRQGQTVFSDFHVGRNSLFARYNNLNVDFWTPENQDAPYPRPNQNQERPRNNTTMGHFDGSFVKLRNVTLGYNLPESVTSKLGLSRLRVYVAGQNLWFAAKYDTFDPELDDDSNPNDLPELDASSTPTSRLMLFGVKAQF
ncbi:MAG: TonB-dependent receptor [Saprospiraceae bacterium]|nr:TonB-dependent receptor [Saprospiraceae bacterium]